MPLCNLRIILFAVLLSYVCYVRAEQSPYARHLGFAFRTIEQMALMDPADRALFDSGVTGMVALLNSMGDEHSDYITSKAAEAFEQEMRQEFGGTGILVTLKGENDKRELVIVAPPEPGTPAADHDIRAQDRIVAIDGKLVSEILQSTTSLGEVTQLIRGPVGKPVTLTVLHKGESTPVDIRIVRALIETDSVMGYRKLPDASWQFHVDDDPSIGYVRIESFAQRTLDELRRVLVELTERPVRGVILDLRENPGGELRGTIDICDMFLPADRLIVQTRDRDNKVIDAYFSSSDTPFPDVPLAVLIDQHSASASEIVAACLQDHDRAVIVGSRSFGKGTVQRLINVGPPRLQNEHLQSGLLKLTTASYWRPSGRNIHRMPKAKQEDEWGVTPDDRMQIESSDNHVLAFLIDQNNRSTYNPNGDALLNDLEGVDEEVKKLLPFDDKALAKAVEYFQ